MSHVDLFFVAHQDDELLTFGGPIADAVQQGHEVYVICCSRGEKSIMRQRLGQGGGCPWHEGAHEARLSERAFTLARDREFFDSCLAMGVARHGIVLLHERFGDGQLLPWEAARIMDAYLDEYPGAKLHTHSFCGGTSQHRDHQALGIGALLVHARREVEMSFWIDPYFGDEVARERPDLAVRTIEPTEMVGTRLAAAADAYALWDPSNDRYAIGYHSVPACHDALREHPMFLVHQADEDGNSCFEALSQWHEKYRKAVFDAPMASRQSGLTSWKGSSASSRASGIPLRSESQRWRPASPIVWEGRCLPPCVPCARAARSESNAHRM